MNKILSCRYSSDNEISDFAKNARAPERTVRAAF